MATVTISKRSDGIANSATASWTGDGAIQTVTLGFQPTHVVLYNETGVIKWEKFDPMVAANSIKTVTAGTTTTDTTSAIVINSDGTLTISAAANVNAQAMKLFARR